MSNDVKLSTFPSSKYEALTLLHMQNKDLRGVSPTELVELYNSTYKEIRQAFSTQPRRKAKNGF